MHDHTDHSTAERSLVPLPSHKLSPGESYPDAMVERGYEHWSVTRNAEAVAQMLRNEFGPEIQTPSARCIREWVHFHAWTARADDDWRTNQGRNLFEMRAQAAASFRLGLHNLLLAATGGIPDPADAMIRLKAAELAIRLVERGVIPLAAIEPPTENVDTSRLTRAEREALAMARMAERKAQRRNDGP
jgi:hypothetical protein